MPSSSMSRRFVIRSLAAAALFPLSAGASEPLDGQTRFRAIRVDVTPLRKTGDRISADFIERTLPAHLQHYFAAYLAPGDRRAPALVARIDSVMYGDEGGASLPGGYGAMDYIEGAGVVIGGGGREVASYPLMSSMTARVNLNDVTGQGVITRMNNLTQSFAQWLPGKMGLR